MATLQPDNSTESLNDEEAVDTDTKNEEDDTLESPVPLVITELPFRDRSISIGTAAEEEYKLSGITLIPDSRHLVACDHGNRTIVLVDEQYNVKSKHFSVFEPWDVTAISATLIVVTFPLVRLLQYFKIKGASRVVPWHPVVSGYEYYGLAHDRDVILATCKYDGTEYIPCVHFIRRDGSIRDSICRDADGNLIFSDPNFIAVNKDNHVIYVSDQGTQSVLRFTGNGHLLSVFSCQKFDPRGISVDTTNGTVLVTDNGTHSVLHLSSSLDMINRRLVAKNDVTKNPLAVVHCFKTDTLFLFMEQSSVLRVFQLPS